MRADANAADVNAVPDLNADTAGIDTGTTGTGDAGTTGNHMIAPGGDFACWLRPNGTVLCWGDNGLGQLGDGTSASRPRAAPVSGLVDAVTISTGEGHACVLKRGGTAACWGRNNFGQIGDSTTQQRNRPTAVNGLGDLIAVDAGYFHSCALRRDGRVLCWGNNVRGQLGLGDMNNRNSPALLTLTDVVQVGSGANHSCARKSDRTVWCWGQGSRAQLGTGVKEDKLTPVQVVNVNDAIDLSVGGYHNCLRRATGQTLCWGNNWNGELGNGEGAYQLETPTPSPAMLNPDVAQIALGIHHSCARRPSGDVLCFGNNMTGAVGIGNTTQLQPIPRAVMKLSDAVDIGLGLHFSCAVTRVADAYCWGTGGSGQLGDGAMSDRTTPVKVMVAP